MPIHRSSQERIEIYNSDNSGARFITIKIPLDAAPGVLACFKKDGVTNPRIAKILDEVIEYTKQNRNCSRFIEKDS